MTKIVGELDLSQIPDAQYKPELELRVAVVREDSVLGSVVLKPAGAKQRRLPFEVEFTPPLLPTCKAAPRAAAFTSLSTETGRSSAWRRPPAKSSSSTSRFTAWRMT